MSTYLWTFNRHEIDTTLTRTSPRKHCFTAPGRAIQQDTLGRPHSESFECIRVKQRPLDSLAQLLNVTGLSADVCIANWGHFDEQRANSERIAWSDGWKRRMKVNISCVDEDDLAEGVPEFVASHRFIAIVPASRTTALRSAPTYPCAREAMARRSSRDILCGVLEGGTPRIEYPASASGMPCIGRSSLLFLFIKVQTYCRNCEVSYTRAFIVGTYLLLGSYCSVAVA